MPNSKQKVTYKSGKELIYELENPASSKYSTEGGLIIFDGVCNLCNAGMQFIDVWNETECLQMGWAQDNTIISSILLYYNISKESIMESFAFIEKNSNNDSNEKSAQSKKNKNNNSNSNCNVYRGSTAWLHIAKYWSFPLNLLYYLIYVPEIIREFVYDNIGKRRYKWFGRSDACQRPTKSLRRRIVHSVVVSQSQQQQQQQSSGDDKKQ